MADSQQWRGSTKLNAQKAREIRERFAKGATADELANAFGVSDQAIKDIVNFETWVSAGGPKPPVTGRTNS